MERVYERCCGLDVHKGSVTACVHVPRREGGRGELIESFTTMTTDLLALRDWLQGLGVTHVAMEATGVYWKPVLVLARGRLRAAALQPGHIKNVPGRKTDVSDAQWLWQLLEHGLCDPSFVPPKPIRELRDLTRYRKTLIRVECSRFRGHLSAWSAMSDRAGRIVGHVHEAVPQAVSAGVPA